MTNEILHKEKLEGISIEILYDEDPGENPFKAWDGQPDIIGWHRNYDFNTRKEDARKDPETFLREAKEQGYIVLPLFMYEHGGIAFSTTRDSYPFNCPWDSGQFGFIFWTKEKIAQGQGEAFVKRLTKKRRAFLVEQLRDAVKLLDDYARGNVYGFVIKDKDGETLDSCWGFYGAYDSEHGCLTEARAIAKHYQNDYLEAQAREIESERPDMYLTA